MTEREIYKTFGNLSEDKLNTKRNKYIYVRNDFMTTIIKRCRGEKKRGMRAIDGFRKKLMIPGSEIPKCPEFEVKSKIGKLFMNEKIIEEYPVKIVETDPYFYEHYKKINKQIKVDKSEREYILFRIDVYLTEYFLAGEIDEQNHEGRELIFENKREKALEKKLCCKYIRINTSNAKKDYDADYEVSKIQTFISEFKYKKIKEPEDEIKN